MPLIYSALIIPGDTFCTKNSVIDCTGDYIKTYKNDLLTSSSGTIKRASLLILHCKKRTICLFSRGVIEHLKELNHSAHKFYSS